MKFIKKRNQYEASNVTCNIEELTAFSYNWWKFLAVINGKLVFNDYSYSTSTRKHQIKVRNLLAEKGIKIDVIVESPKGLSDLWEESALNLLKYEKQQLTEILANNRRKKALDESRLQRLEQIAAKELVILELREGSKLGAVLV